MATQVREAFAKEVSFKDDSLVVSLVDGRVISVPLAWYPRLAFASEKDLNTWEFIGPGVGIHWPTLDEDLSVNGMLAGK